MGGEFCVSLCVKETCPFFHCPWKSAVANNVAQKWGYWYAMRMISGDTRDVVCEVWIVFVSLRPFKTLFSVQTTSNEVKNGNNNQIRTWVDKVVAYFKRLFGTAFYTRLSEEILIAFWSWFVFGIYFEVFTQPVLLSCLYLYWLWTM